MASLTGQSWPVTTIKPGQAYPPRFQIPNLKFLATIPEVFISCRLHEWIKLNSMCDLSGQTAVFDRFVSRLKFWPHQTTTEWKNVTPKIYRSYPIKGRTPLIETQKNVRNKSTIVVQKCNPNNRQSLIRVGSCKFQIHLCILAYVITANSHARLNWCKGLISNLIHSKIFNLAKYREVLVKYSLLITHAGMPMRIWHQLRERLTDSFF